MITSLLLTGTFITFTYFNSMRENPPGSTGRLVAVVGDNERRDPAARRAGSHLQRGAGPAAVPAARQGAAAG